MARDINEELLTQERLSVKKERTNRKSVRRKDHFLTTQQTFQTAQIRDTAQIRESFTKVSTHMPRIVTNQANIKVV